MALFVRRCLSGDQMNPIARQALLAVLAAAWVVGLIHQLNSWTMTVAYVGISLAMAAVMLADRRVLKYATRRINKRR
jgi:ABC-type iron transport system FetAB permease component